MVDYEELSSEELEEEYDRLLDEINTAEIALTRVVNELASLTAPEQLGEIPLAQQAIRWERIGVLIKELGYLIQEVERLAEAFGVVQWYLDQGNEQG